MVGVEMVMGEIVTCLAVRGVVMVVVEVLVMDVDDCNCGW